MDAEEKKGEDEYRTAKAKTFCFLAKSDLRHDFNVGVVDINNIASHSVPEPGPDICDSRSDEDDVLRMLMGIGKEVRNFDVMTARGPKPGTKKLVVQNPDIIRDYNVDNMDVDLTRADGLRACFNNIAGDIFLVVDFYREPFRDVLVNLDATMGPADNKIFWVYNRQVQYDPASKTTPNTDAGIMFNGKNRLFFCWENSAAPTFNPFEYYPKWDIPHNIIIDPKTFQPINKLFYSKDDIHMILKTDKRENYFMYQTPLCHIQTEDNRMILMDKAMAAKGVNVFANGSYSHLREKYKLVLDELRLQIRVRTIEPTTLDIDNHHYVAKRLGDQGQALSCCKSSMDLSYIAKDGTTQSIRSNGNHCFVTEDRLALTAALLYRVPIIIYLYRTSNRCAVFISRDRLDPQARLVMLQQNIEQATAEWTALRNLMKDNKDIIYEIRESYYRHLEEQYVHIRRRLDHYREQFALHYIYFNQAMNQIRSRVPTGIPVYITREIRADIEAVSQPIEDEFRNCIAELYSYVLWLEITLSMYNDNVDFINNTLNAIIPDNDVILGAMNDSVAAAEQVRGNVEQYTNILHNANETLKNHIQSLQTVKGIYEKLQTYVSSPPVGIGQEHISNISESSLFTLPRTTLRGFVQKAEASTLCDYMREIYKTFANLSNPATGEPYVLNDIPGTFKKLLKQFVGIVRVGVYDKEYIKQKITYIGFYFSDVISQLDSEDVLEKNDSENLMKAMIKFKERQTETRLERARERAREQRREEFRGKISQRRENTLAQRRRRGGDGTNKINNTTQTKKKKKKTYRNMMAEAMGLSNGSSKNTTTNKGKNLQTEGVKAENVTQGIQTASEELDSDTLETLEALEALEGDAAIRSAFAIIVAALCDKRQLVFETGTKWDNKYLGMIEEKLQEDDTWEETTVPAKKIQIQAIKPLEDGRLKGAKPVKGYVKYIDFVQKQINRWQTPDILTMYDQLQESDYDTFDAETEDARPPFVIPKGIEERFVKFITRPRLSKAITQQLENPISIHANQPWVKQSAWQPTEVEASIYGGESRKTSHKKKWHARRHPLQRTRKQQHRKQKNHKNHKNQKTRKNQKK